MLVLEGRPAEALSAMRDSRAEEEIRLFLQALAEHSLGHAAESRRALDALVARHAHSMAFQIAETHAWRGERDAAFAWLERADAQFDGGIMMLKYSPFLRELHADPRWPALLRKLNLPVR
jgi:serine/threonine-protein kinase